MILPGFVLHVILFMLSVICIWQLDHLCSCPYHAFGNLWLLPRLTRPLWNKLDASERVVKRGSNQTMPLPGFVYTLLHIFCFACYYVEAFSDLHLALDHQPLFLSVGFSRHVWQNGCSSVYNALCGINYRLPSVT